MFYSGATRKFYLLFVMQAFPFDIRSMASQSRSRQTLECIRNKLALCCLGSMLASNARLIGPEIVWSFFGAS